MNRDRVVVARQRILNVPHQKKEFKESKELLLLTDIVWQRFLMNYSNNGFWSII